MGTSEWLVFENTGAGFADEPLHWPLPTPIAADWLDDLAEDTYVGCAEDYYAVSTLDLTGDGLPDLVQTDACDVAGVGTTSWRVFENTGTGFAATPIEWALPDALERDWLDDLYEDTYVGCDEDYYAVSTLDLTGDGRPDLVMTDDCDTAGIGTNAWLVFENQGDGFASTPLEWALPRGPERDWLDDLAEDTYVGCAEDYYAASTLDLTGDGVPDLVMTDDCDTAGVGTTSWKVFPGRCED
ncbi:MAG: hypothetical protein R3F59_18555 [Myxococcota bacterium]